MHGLSDAGLPFFLCNAELKVGVLHMLEAKVMDYACVR